MSKKDIHQTLNELHRAQEKHNLDGILDVYADNGFINKDSLRSDLQDQFAHGVFKGRNISFSHCETFVFEDTALVRPIVYDTSQGTHSFSFHLSKQNNGSWKIIDNSRSYVPGESIYSEELVNNAGKLVGEKGMWWTRKLGSPVERVWEVISTSEGLRQWWIGGKATIDLQIGGMFKHHWNNRIAEIEPYERIVFIEESSVPGAKAYMSFELEADGNDTLFHFFDAFYGVTTPLTLPWTASGWHGTVDKLETTLTGRKIKNDFGLGGEFYWRYLRNHHEREVATQDKISTDSTQATEWRDAYLTQPVGGKT